MRYLFIALLFSSALGANPPAQTALFVFAHPDDELIANGTLIHLLNKGVDVHVAYTTSGKLGTDVRGIIKNNPDKLAQQRQSEAVQALAVTGITAPNIYFLNMDDYATDTYRMAEKLKNLFSEIKPTLVVTFGPDGLYGHKDHRSLAAIISFLFNNSKDSLVLLYAQISESRDQGYGFTHGRGSPSKGYDYIHRVADGAINYQLDVSAYADLQKESLAQYPSQFSSLEMQQINTFYDQAQCPGGAVKVNCEQYIVARFKPGTDVNALLRPLGFYPTQ